MIGRLAGRIVHRGTDHVIIDAGGVGYVVHVSDRTLAGLPPVGEAAMLWTDLLVREDLLQLFGFATLQEKEWHRLLCTVQGVGARAAMAILGALGADGIGRAVALGDLASIRAAPGIGPKIAQRVAIELKGKAPAVMAMGAGPVAPPPGGGPAPSVAPGAEAEALSALANLGYGPQEAAGAVARAAGEGADTTAGLIRAALRLLAPKEG
ncbi:Holliday junction DNA helicase RuvA [Oceaniovalibus guishaninsula JLT2003]|uniref:Holliday junction branch migration complex subunit RuvA n=1 Tax=Oceaniovalibus guishaninsula JLT2003 TaxID=1231392 RepID=K2I643_9RHOB|nr:Holliday junction branch migration protein RuvA [Oceaniovalibus guishaninsula]EKE44455.1 Holliday junction DNA helicase RuvA [Oceaniovalibus guishaninsula JLT2003]